MDPEFVGELAIAYLRRNMWRVTQTLIERAPQTAHTIVARALIARAQGALDDAGLLAHLDAALEDQPGAHELRIIRAQTRLSVEQFGSALKDASIALVQQPDDPRALEVRAVALMGLGRLEEAQTALRAAAEDTRSPFTLIAMADVDMVQGNLESARRYLRRARWWYGKEPEVYDALARLARHEGDDAKAEKHTRHAAELRRQ